ncbi:ABC transporter permease [Micrococcus porci]|uniref:ABC transporter permease n=1 Tax=Micrococcus porci TaxID=2856555 RepID=UPI003CF8BC7B
MAAQIPASAPLQPPITAAESAVRVKARGAWSYAEHVLRSVRRYGAVLIVGALSEPILYLLAMGLGMAQVMGGGAPQESLGGVSYVTFLAPALLASGAPMTTATEFSYPVMGGFQWHRTYYAAQATPLSPAQIAVGHLGAVALRFLFQAAVFFGVMLAFGVVHSSWGWVQVLTAALGGLAVGAPIMAFSASLKEDHGQFATLQRLVIMPLFLFSATFYPLEALPAWLRWVGWISPQWHAAQLGRVLSYGMAEPRWLTVLHVAVLLSLASGGGPRLDRGGAGPPGRRTDGAGGPRAIVGRRLAAVLPGRRPLVQGPAPAPARGGPTAGAAGVLGS